MIDTKNYGNASGMFGNFKQLKAYLGEIHSFDELLIIQQHGRGFEIKQIQSAFQTALKNNFDEAFSIIYNKNINLKQNLFKGLNEADAKTKLLKMINNKNSNLYKILKLTL